jgi:putative transposase
VAKGHGITDATIYAWRKRFEQLEGVDVKRLHQLEQENARLKTLVAERGVSVDERARSDNGP